MDSAAAVALNSTIQLELLDEIEPVATRDQGRTEIAAFVDDYNHERFHSTLGMPAP